MRNLIKNSLFIVGLFCGTIIYFWLTITIDRSVRGLPCFDCQWKTGFPFAYYQYEGFVEPARYLWIGLITDVLIGIIFSFVVGLIFKFVWEKLMMKKLR